MNNKLLLTQIKGAKYEIQSHFYHAGCPVCLEAESKLLHSLDREQHEVETVHFAECPERINEAESLGVRSVPAMVLHNEVFHINFGASIDELKASQ